MRVISFGAVSSGPYRHCLSFHLVITLFSSLFYSFADYVPSLARIAKSIRVGYWLWTEIWLALGNSHWHLHQSIGGAGRDPRAGQLGPARTRVGA